MNGDTFHIILGSFSVMGLSAALVGTVASIAEKRVGLWALNLAFIWVNAAFAAYNFSQLAS